MLRDIKIGDQIGGYKVIEIFGGNNQKDIEDESGLGVVYLGGNINSNDVIALKTFQDQYIYESDIKNEFKFESLEWIKLKPHPNVVTAFAADIIEDRPFLYLEPIIPINGKQTLKHFLKDYLDLKQILDWSIQFCYGMEYVNEEGIKVHGDIKPDNILIFFNIVKISDFGLLELFEKSDENFISKYYSKNNCQGTLEYMAPEVFDGKRSIESDIYSFGVVLYQLVNRGEMLFKDDGSYDWQKIHLETEIPHMESVLNDIIHKCLENEPQNRYHSFKDLRMDLEEIFKKEYENLYKPDLIDVDDEFYYAMLGHSYCVYGDEKLFREYYNKALKSDNNFVRFMYADNLMDFNEFSEAIENYEIIIDTLSKSEAEFIHKDRIYFNLGNAYSSINRICDAMDNYKKVLNENKDFVNAKVNLGNCYKALGDFEKSFSYYDEVLNEFPNFYEALYNKGLLLCEIGDSEEAEILFGKIDDNLDEGKRFLDKSLVYASIDIRKSFLELTQYVGRHEDMLSKYMLLNLHLAMGKFDLAKSVYEDLLNEWSDKDEIRILVQNMFYQYGCEEYAFDILEEIRVSENKKCKFEYYLLKAYLIKDSDISYTNRLLNHVIKKSPSNRQKSEAYNFKFVFNEIKQIRYVHNALKLNPNNRDAHLNYISYYINDMKLEKALKRIKYSFKKFENDSDIYFFKGKVYFIKKEFEKALSLLILAMKYGKIDSEIYLNVRDCYIELGDDDKAYYYEKLAVNLDKNHEFSEFLKFGC